MRERFKTIRRLLEKDLEFERNAVKTYNGFSERIGDERFKEIFQSLAEDEAGHTAGLTEKLNDLKMGEVEVKFYCPRCGWTLNFGKNPNFGHEVKCPMCGNIFRLTWKNGDPNIEEIKE